MEVTGEKENRFTNVFHVLSPIPNQITIACASNFADRGEIELQEN